MSDIKIELDTLKQQMREQASVIQNLEAQVALQEPIELTTRRNAFKKLAIGAVGAVAGAGVLSALVSEPAAATNGGPVVLGASNTSQSETILSYTLATTLTNGVFVSTDNALATPPAHAAGVAGYSYGRVKNGVYGYNETDQFGSGVIGVSASGVGVFAQGDAAANLLTHPAGLPAPERTGFLHRQGMIVCDSSGDLWLCVGAGTPGAWRKLSGFGTAGALHALPEPLRAFDSRQAPGSRLLANTTTTVSVAMGVNGANVAVPAVPPGASAALLNITLTGTVGNFGFISAYSAKLSTPPLASTMNWSTQDDNVANEVTVALDANANIKLTPGVNNTHIIIDVVGYYR